MKISDLETVLAKWKEQLGDVEIKEATREYGHTEFKQSTLKSFIRLEKTTFRDGTVESHLVIGRH